MSAGGDAVIIIPWLFFDLAGQISLLALLVTFVVFKHLPQHNNPFLINFILATFLSTIPPALLFYAGQMYNASAKLCFAQAALVDGIAPMFSVAQLVLVFDTWCELRCLCLRKRHISRGPITRYILIFAPYVAMWVWTFGSFIAAMQSKADHSSGFVYCQMGSIASKALRMYVGAFVGILGIFEILLEVWVGWLIYSYPARKQEDPTAWRTGAQFALRVIIFTSLQVFTIFLSLLNNKLQSHPVKLAYELLTSMNALAAFVAFGTQKNVLRTWKFWGRKRTNEDPDEIQPQGYPMTDWADVPLHQFKQYDGDAFDLEERGKPGYIKTWLKK